MTTTLGDQRDFRALFDQLDGVALWTATDPGRFDYISDGFEDVWGIPPARVRDDVDELLDTIHPEDRERARANIEAPPDGRGLPDSSYEGRIIRPDGSVRWVLTRQALIRDHRGEVTEVVGISTDITEQKRREQELEMLNRIVRHDIRNDLSVLLGWADVLEEYVDDEGTEYLDKMRNSGEHVVELTKIARDYVETVVADEDLTVEPTPIADVLETELALREESHPNAEFVVDGSLPDVEVAANEVLGSVFRNLLNNAVQHNDAETPVVEVSCEVRDDDVTVRIADNGPGIPDERKERIFGKGEKGLDSPGTGIGLYLVHTLVSQYGGEVRVEDADPTGSVFVVRLPKAADWGA
jgi:PAS domain S-box-containing protein